MFKLENEELIQESKTYSGRVECLILKIKDDFILYGDLMNSLTVLRYNTAEQQFEEVNIDDSNDPCFDDCCLDCS